MVKRKTWQTLANKWWIYDLRWEWWRVKSIVNFISVLNRILFWNFDHRLNAGFSYIVFDDTHLGLKISHFIPWKWLDKRQELQENCKMFSFSLVINTQNYLSIYFLVSFASFFQKWHVVKIKQLLLLCSSPDTIKMYGKLNAFAYVIFET